MSQYYSFDTFETADIQDYLPLTLSIVNAILSVDNWSLVEVIKNDSIDAQLIIADTETDSVPSRNIVGIKYRERLALAVRADKKIVIDALALRKDFPNTLHQNSTIPGTPRSLCLYYEIEESIKRSWTPQKHLRRITHWLEKTSKGTLHSSDQPLETVFFESNFDLVLPCDIDEELLNPQGRLLSVKKYRSREKDGGTIVTDWMLPDDDPKVTSTVVVPINCEPVVSREIEHAPHSLNSLIDELGRKGTNLSLCLKKFFLKIIPEYGVEKTNEEFRTTFLLTVPILREEGGAIEKFQKTAFMCFESIWEIGIALDLVTLSEGSYYSFELLGGEHETHLGSQINIYQINVSQIPLSSERRKKSGVLQENISGLVVGVGALGSVIVEHWSRSGWGQWIVTDIDHLKPHNLIRHELDFRYIGFNKAYALAAHCANTFPDASKITPSHKDILTDSKIQELVSELNVVVDCSTTLEYPRFASTREDFPRQASLFVTPNGKNAVMLLEDANRKIKLSNIESQYYRAIINSDWGQLHLEDNLGMFWSGGSCRDMSFVLSNERITSLATVLSEQLRIKLQDDSATAIVWSENPLTGERTRHLIELTSNNEFSFDNFTVNIDQGLINKLYKLRERGLPNETGGMLLGYYDFNISSIFIVDVLPEPSDSTSSPSLFQRGIEGIKETLDMVNERTAGLVDYIGEWHSHPSNCSSNPSNQDICQLADLAMKMNMDGLPALSLIVGENDISIGQVQVKQ